MGRLTEKEESGAWQVKGIAWENLQVGKVITKKTEEQIYGCLCKLKDYENIGLDPDQLSGLLYQIKDMADHVCDKMCCHPMGAETQEELDRLCAECPVSSCLGRITALT